jgi:formylglycine-generating enzyme
MQNRIVYRHLPLEHSLFLGGCLWAFCMFAISASTGPTLATLITGHDQPKELTNGLGMNFLPIENSAIMMSIWETRVSDWEMYLKETQTSWEHRPAFAQTPEHPVVNITLEEARAFCAWLTRREQTSGAIKPTQRYRLPTPAEWNAAVGIAPANSEVKAAGQQFPWGEEWPPLRQSGNYNSNHIPGGRQDGFEYTAPVGQFSPSAAGIYDLGGNVWEWTDDSQPSTDLAMLRGGSWLYWRRETLESGHVYPIKHDTRAPSIGFRCVFEDSAAAAMQQQKISNSKSQQRNTLTEKQVVSEKEITLAKEKMEQSKSELDMDDLRKLREKPKVTQDEINKARKELNRPPPRP